MKSKKPAVKEHAEKAKMEHSGHWIEGNIWFNLGLSKTEAKMLKAVATRIFDGKVTSALTARALLQAALAHYDVLEPLILQDAAYAHDEGFLSLDCYRSKVIAEQCSKLAEVAA
jgi:hypothetical protein